ncbi:hypothetical protein TB2_031881 [Malus domestica]
MPAGKGKVRYAIVTVDYFTKWAEVKPLANIIEAKIEDFVWKNILCRFGIPNAIVLTTADNSTTISSGCSTLSSTSTYVLPAQLIPSLMDKLKPSKK